MLGEQYSSFWGGFFVTVRFYVSLLQLVLFGRLIQQRFKQTIVSARFGGPREATKRLLAQLPISAQSYSCSPYLDLALFSYDDKWVSGMERPKACGEHPIRFCMKLLFFPSESF